MGRTLDDDISDDVGAVFLNDEEFAEDVVFTPQNGAARTITAIVEQQMSPLKDGRAEQERVNHIRVTCRDDATEGIHEVNLVDRLAWNDRKWTKPEIVERVGGMVTVSFQSMEVETYRRGR
jgi:hypothetical protein